MHGAPDPAGQREDDDMATRKSAAQKAAETKAKDAPETDEAKAAEETTETENPVGDAAPLDPPADDNQPDEGAGEKDEENHTSVLPGDTDPAEAPTDASADPAEPKPTEKSEPRTAPLDAPAPQVEPAQVEPVGTSGDEATARVRNTEFAAITLGDGTAPDPDNLFTEVDATGTRTLKHELLIHERLIFNRERTGLLAPRGRRFTPARAEVVINRVKGQQAERA